MHACTSELLGSAYAYPSTSSLSGRGASASAVVTVTAMEPARRVVGGCALSSLSLSSSSHVTSRLAVVDHDGEEIEDDVDAEAEIEGELDNPT